MGGISGVTCVIADPHAAQTVATFSGNLTNLAGASVSLVPIYRTSKARLTVVGGLGSGHYDLGGTPDAEITALPAPAGLRFDRWESTAPVQDPTKASTRITLTNGPILVNALYVSAQPAIQSVRQAGSDVVVEWTASSGMKYTLQTSPELSPNAVWSDVYPADRPGPTASPWTMSGTNPAPAAAAAQFYRVRAKP